MPRGIPWLECVNGLAPRRATGRPENGRESRLHRGNEFPPAAAGVERSFRTRSSTSTVRTARLVRLSLEYFETNAMRNSGKEVGRGGVTDG